MHLMKIANRSATTYSAAAVEGYEITEADAEFFTWVEEDNSNNG